MQIPLTMIFLAILISYLLGSLPTGFLVARAKGIDIRQHGSGSTGATNVFRTIGKKPGIFVFICDALKGFIAVWIAWHYFANGHLSPALIAIIAGIVCILGHNFPVWLKFKGGKGVATSLGVVIGLFPIAAGVAFIVWMIVFFVTRYVSLASLLAAIAVPVTVAVDPGMPEKTPLLIFAIIAALLVIVRHQSNIQRLIAGTENRFSKKKK